MALLATRFGPPLIFPKISSNMKKKGREERKCHSKAGRKSLGSRKMLKVLVLKQLYNLSYEQVEYQLKDRLSFMHFVGVGLNGTVPDENTVRNCFELYKETGAWDKLFKKFNRMPSLLTIPGFLFFETFLRVIT